MRIIKNYWPLGLVITVYSALLILYFYHFNSTFSLDKGDWGTFGDFFGGALSPLIGIISIILTYSIINKQSIETAQAEFKNVFQILFDSIDNKRDLIERKGRPNTSGKKAIARINKDIESVYKFKRKQNPNSSSLELFSESFWSVHDDINGSSSPYMKVLHNCLKSIDKYCIKEKQEIYSSLVRAQLHQDELVFVFYNAIASNDFIGFKSRIEKFSILKDVIDYSFPPELKAEYSTTAFTEGSDEARVLSHHNRLFSFEFKFLFNRA